MMQRRQFLRGVGGVLVALPFLESFAPRRARAADPPKRLAVFFSCNGVNMEKFWPKTPYGPLTAASLAGTGMAPLADYASKILVPRGIHLVPRGWGRDPAGGDDHAKGVGHRLTAAPNQMTNERYASGASLDHVVAKSINPGGKGPLNLMVGYRNNDVLGSFSYTSAGQQAIPFQDPWKAFKDWATTGNGTGGMTIDRLAMRRRSVLDAVKGDLDALKNSSVLGAADRQKLDMHLTAVRGLEAAVMSSGVVSCGLAADKMSAIMGINPSTVTRDSEYVKIGDMLLDVMALALACDQNRVATIQWGSGAGGPIFSWLGMNADDVNNKYNHHKLSHGSTTDCATSPNLPADQWKTALFNIDTWYMQRFKGLLDRLAMYSEPNGSVLDNTAVCYMNDLGDGLGHNWMDLPNIIAGGAGGYFKLGQYVKLTNGTGTANDTDAPSNMLLTTLANAVGAKQADGSPITNFGSAPTGKPGEF
ncbi:MAG TPA: DUF1552 domain-containing protein, partial [Polyangiales bacterium]|nr:DUF1552 domain-containing protein [Polyangiales bacterium]